MLLTGIVWERQEMIISPPSEWWQRYRDGIYSDQNHRFILVITKFMLARDAMMMMMVVTSAFAENEHRE